MKFIDEYRDVELGKKLVARINQLSTRPMAAKGRRLAFRKNFPFHKEQRANE
jgi:hypothetical protein